MKRDDKQPDGRPHRQPASAAMAGCGAASTMDDRRPGAAAQRQLMEAIADGPRTQHSSPVAQRQRVEEEEPLQGRFEAPARRREAETAAPNRTGLPDGLKAGIESMSGLSMDHVRVHYGSSQPAQLNALAYAQGSDIHLAPGQEQHLPHEAWHVVQQAQGRVRPTMQMKTGVAINDDARLEREADEMGRQALSVGGRAVSQASGEPANASQALQPPTGTSIQAKSGEGVVQREVEMAYGTWRTDTYDPWIGDGSGEGEEIDRRGCSIKLVFDPKPTVDAKKIGLVQELQSSVGGAIEGPDNDASQIHSDQALRNVPSGAPVGGGHRIDRGPGESVPVYGAEIPSVARNRNWSAIKIGKPETQLGYRFDLPGKPPASTQKAATLLDTPNRRNAQQNSHMEFETTALAVEGAQNGTYYGSVKWGWRTDAGGVYTLIPLAAVSEGKPSDTFMAAAARWNEVEGARGLSLPL